MKTIVRREERVETNEYELAITPDFIEEMVNDIKNRYTVEGYEDFNLTEDDVIFAFCEEFGVFDDELNEEEVNKDLLKAPVIHKIYPHNYRVPLAIVIADYVNDSVWNVEPEYIDGETTDVSDFILNHK